MDNSNPRNYSTKRFDNCQNGIRTILSSNFRQQNSYDEERFQKQNTKFKASNRGRQNAPRFQNRNENNSENRLENETNEIHDHEGQQLRFNDLRHHPSINRNNAGGAGKRYSSQRHNRVVVTNNAERFEQLQQQNYTQQHQKYPTNQYNNPPPNRNGYNQQRNNCYNHPPERSFNNGTQMASRYSGQLRTDIPPPPNNNQFVDRGYTMSAQPHYAGTSQQGHFTPHMLQPTNVMYFDPNQQQQPPPQIIATRRVLHIAPPEQN